MTLLLVPDWSLVTVRVRERPKASVYYELMHCRAIGGACPPPPQLSKACPSPTISCPVTVAATDTEAAVRMPRL
eukprot:COSAG01_NODE_9523_length_2420_cov_4.781129_1_plen_73_part_10